MPSISIGIFASGSGSNAERIVEHFQASELAHVSMIATNRPDAAVRKRAFRLGIESVLMPPATYRSGEKLQALLKRYDIDLLVLAGYLKLIPQTLIQAYPQRIINIHPALLPKYGGKGMYGMRVHEAVIQAKESESGITIHYVNEQYDEGPVILQEKVAIQAHWTAEDLQKAIQSLEHTHFPSAIEQICQQLPKI